MDSNGKDNIDEDIPTNRIKVSNLPSNVTEDEIQHFFENRKVSGGRDVEFVDYEKESNTAFVIFKEVEAVEAVISKTPLLFDDKTTIKIEKIYLEDEPDVEEYNRCTIEVTGMSQSSTKNGVKLYFESKKGGNADVLSLDYVEEEEMYLIRFESEGVVDECLTKTHRFDKTDLYVRKHIPLQPDATYPKQAFISGFNMKTSEEALRNYLEARSKTDVNKFIFGDIEGTAIVEFKTQPDIEKLTSECKKRQLNGCFLKVESVPVSKSIVVSKIKPGTTKDAVMFYFDNERRSGVTGVEEVDLDNTNNTCIVDFVDCEAPVTACKKEHKIEGSVVKVDIYHKCLGGTASGDGPKFKSLDPLSVDLGVKIVQFLSNSETAKEEVNKVLKPYYACIRKWPADKSPTIIIECTLTADTKDCKKLVKTWEDDVGKCLKTFVASLHVEKCEMLQDAWTPVIDRLRSVSIDKPDLVALSVEKKEFEIYIMGYKKQVTELSKQVKSIIAEVSADIEKKKQQVKEKASLKYHQIAILVLRDFPTKMMKSCKELKVEVDWDRLVVTFEGLGKDVMAAKLKMFEETQDLAAVSMGSLSKQMVEFVESSEVSNFIKEQFKKKKKIGVWEKSDGSLTMYAMSDKDAHECIKICKNCVVESFVSIEDAQSSFMKTDKWREAVDKIKGKCQNQIVEIFHDPSGKIVILCTLESKIGMIREDIEDFLRDNTVENVSLELSPGEMKVINLHFKSKFEGIEKEFQKDKVQISLAAKSVIITGNSKGIKAAKIKVENIIKEISTQEHTVSKPGVFKFMKTDQGRRTVTTTEKEVGVIIQPLIDGENDMTKDEDTVMFKQPFINPSGITQIAQSNVAGRLVVAVLGDITQLEVDVIVNAANEDLDHRGGLAKVIVNKGGKDIQTECTKHVKQKGKLSEGEVFCSKAGKLKCKMIAHAFGPVWKNGRSNEEDRLRDCVITSMDESHDRSMSSIAIPAISTGIFGYPTDKATKVIVEAVQDYFKQNSNSKIKKVYLCDVKDCTVKLFVDGMKKYLGTAKLLADPEETVSPWKNHVQPSEPGRHGNKGREGTVQFGSISVRVVKGQLAQQKVDVIVNSTSSNLNLENGMLSQSVLRAGGQRLQNECTQNYPNGIKEGEVAITTGGKLSCKNVLHGCLPSWHHDQSSIKILETFITECLNVSTKKQHKSIAFPSLGTGKLGYPVDQVAKHMFSCIESFTESAPKSTITEVLLVVYDQDYKSIKGFDDEFNRRVVYTGRSKERFSKERQPPQEERYRPRTARPTTSHGRPHIINFGKIELKIYQGDITVVGVDVLVYSSNTECDLSRGAVARAILKKGGSDVTTELNKQKDKMKKDLLVVTSGGNLPCDKIIHLDMLNTSKDLKWKIFQVLKKTDDLQKHKVAIPALGTANANVSVYQVATDMLGVISQYRPQHVQEVHVVIYENSMLKSFIDATGKCRDQIKAEPAQYGDKVVADMGLGPRSKTRIERELKETDTGKTPALSEVKCVIFGKVKSDTDKAVKVLEKNISAEIKDKEIKAGKVLKEFRKDQEDELKKIEALCGVEIKIDKKSEKIVLKGFTVNLSIALEKANMIVKDAEQDRLAGLKANLVSESVQWYYICSKKGDKDELVEYPSKTNLQLEQDFESLKPSSSIIDKDGNKFIIDFTDMEEYAHNDKNDRVKVLRKSKISGKDTTFKIPDDWEIMDDKENCKVVILSPSTSEFQTVSKKFISSVGSQRQIVEIHRIQNKTLYQQYVAKKKSIDSTNPPGHQNENSLWHGFAKDAMDSINKFGFNRSYCGKNATAYGDGVYFASAANYSASNTYSVPDSNGNKRMYLCKVLTGEYTYGQGGMRMPPTKAGTHILYDCVVDNPANPGMFIIFHDAQAYPEYMIMFK
ncbi:protein mono-ADP-ribosyltransferase PARP14-like [Mytilus trossulus]|uniref:protein mono-ADP-ribosyltransferase PARP14-like n=1 Tax=Mytilus trossulus TaxID=6551 RepID=UPI0030061730